MVFWTWKKHRIVPSRKAGSELLKLWKVWYERQGWRVRGSTAKYLTAYHPDWPSTYTRHSAGLVAMEPDQIERIQLP